MLDRIILFPYYLYLKGCNAWYNKGGKRVKTAEVPTLCVGNVTAGGTGKTPHVEMIVSLLGEIPQWAGCHPAVLSRGYKRESKGFQQVLQDSSVTLSGDEPLQIKKNCPNATVAVDKDRVEGCHLLVHPDLLKNGKNSSRCWNPDFPPADIIILDDAFQYRRLKASRSIVLVDYNRPVFKDSLLPFGRLRDLPERIADADALIISKCPEDLEESNRSELASKLGFVSYDAQSCIATRADGRRQLLFFTKTGYSAPVPVFPDGESRYIYSRKIIVMTGIAKDTPFCKLLSDSYKIVRRFSFPDHHNYSWSDINKLRSALRKYPTAAIATTQKDAQRLLEVKGMPREISDRMFMVPIKSVFLSENEKTVFKDFLASLKTA